MRFPIIVPLETEIEYPEWSKQPSCIVDVLRHVAHNLVAMLYHFVNLVSTATMRLRISKGKNIQSSGKKDINRELMRKK